MPPGPQRQPMAGTRGQRVCVRRPGGAAGGRKAVGEPTVVGAVVAVDKRRDESAHLQCGVLARLVLGSAIIRGRTARSAGSRGASGGALDHLQRSSGSALLRMALAGCVRDGMPRRRRRLGCGSAVATPPQPGDSHGSTGCGP